jgi:hypothetical protein
MRRCLSAAACHRYSGRRWAAFFSHVLVPVLLSSTFGVDATLDSPPTITGNCNPTRVHFAAHLTATGAGNVTYVWLRSDKGASAVQKLEFSKAGPLPVSYDWLIRARTSGWVSLKVLTPAPQQSRKVSFEVTCR